jgi:hypothetical protein
MIAEYKKLITEKLKMIIGSISIPAGQLYWDWEQKKPKSDFFILS